MSRGGGEEASEGLEGLVLPSWVKRQKKAKVSPRSKAAGEHGRWESLALPVARVGGTEIGKGDLPGTTADLSPEMGQN